MTTPIVIPPADSDNLKQCTQCGEYKPLAAFSRHASSKDGLRSNCRKCASEKHLKYRTENREKVLAQKAEYRENNKDKILDYAANYRAAKRGKIRERENNARLEAKPLLEAKRLRRLELSQMTPEERKADTRARQRVRRMSDKLHGKRRKGRKNKAGVEQQKHASQWTAIVSSARARSRARGLVVNFSVEDAQSALEYFGGCCAVCGRPAGLWHVIGMDHWIPITSPDCAGTVPWNMVPLCHGVGGCNNAKNNRDAAEWLISKFGKKKGGIILRQIESYLESRKPVLAEGD